jgi:hypothetical protein
MTARPGDVTELEEEGKLEDGTLVPSEDLMYAERYCACGSLRRMRGRRVQLFGDGVEGSPNQFGMIGTFEQAHKGGRHKPVPEAEALRIRESIQERAQRPVRGGE